MVDDIVTAKHGAQYANQALDLCNASYTTLYHLSVSYTTLYILSVLYLIDMFSKLFDSSVWSVVPYVAACTWLIRD